MQILQDFTKWFESTSSRFLVPFDYPWIQYRRTCIWYKFCMDIINLEESIFNPLCGDSNEYLHVNLVTSTCCFSHMTCLKVTWLVLTLISKIWWPFEPWCNGLEEISSIWLGGKLSFSFSYIKNSMSKVFKSACVSNFQIKMIFFFFFVRFVFVWWVRDYYCSWSLLVSFWIHECTNIPCLNFFPLLWMISASLLKS